MALAPADTLFDQITDFLISRPTAEQIVEFRASEQLDQRLHELLDKNSGAGLTPDERAEMDRFLQVNHLLIVLKAKARLKLADRE
jgi:hypothetical protein